MKSHTPFNLVVHALQTPENRVSLSQQIASAHAQAICQYISNLKCPIVHQIQADRLDTGAFPLTHSLTPVPHSAPSDGSAVYFYTDGYKTGYAIAMAYFALQISCVPDLYVQFTTYCSKKPPNYNLNLKIL